MLENRGYFLVLNALAFLMQRSIVGSTPSNEEKQNDNNSLTAIDKAERPTPSHNLQIEASEISCLSADELKKWGDEHSRKHEFLEAIACYSQAIDKIPTQSEYYHDRAVCYSRLKKSQLAVEDYLRAIKLEPKNPETEFFLGRQLFEMEEFEQAIDHLQKALKFHGKGMTVTYLKSQVISLLQEARRRITEGVPNEDVQPDDSSKSVPIIDAEGTKCLTADLLKDVGDEHYRAGKFVIAEDCYNQAINISPKEPSYFIRRGLCHTGMMNADLALADFEKAVDVKPDDVKSLFFLGRQLFDMERFDEALTHLEKAFEIGRDRSVMMKNERSLVASMLETIREKLREMEEGGAEHRKQR